MAITGININGIERFFCVLTSVLDTTRWMGQRNPNHQFIDGKHPIILGFQPSGWWCRISLAHPQYEKNWVKYLSDGESIANISPVSRSLFFDFSFIPILRNYY